MTKYPYVVAYLVCFGLGAYLWKAKNSGVAPNLDKDVPVVNKDPDFGGASVVAKVGKIPISQEDLDWEYRQLTEGVTDQESLTPIPDLGDRYHQELAPLRKSLLTGLIERKLLFSYLQQDASFGYDNPARYSACMGEFQQATSTGAQSRDNRDRLKSRLCERSILKQYLKERLYADIKIDDHEVVEYYKNHNGDYKTPERAQIRHILLGSEQEARKWRAQINLRNFAAIARDHSLAPEAAAGGMIGPFAKGGMPAVFEVAFRMNKGEISDVLKSNYGYHIIMLIDHFPKRQPSLAEARVKIIATLRQRQEEERFGKWVDQALAAINVTAPKAMW